MPAHMWRSQHAHPLQVPRSSITMDASSSASDLTGPKNCNDGATTSRTPCQTAYDPTDKSPWLSARYPCSVSLGSAALW